MLVTQNKPTTDEEYHHAKEREYWEKQLFLNRWLAWVTTVGVSVGMISLWLLKGTLDVTWEAAGAARDSADIAAQTLKLDQRPWVFVTEFADMSYQVGEFPRFKLNVVNTGRTPGKIVERSLSLVVVSRDLLSQTPQYKEFWPTNFFVFPDVTGSMSGVGARIVTQPDWALIYSGQSDIFVYGYIRYEDVFGESYWTGFILAFNSQLKVVENPPYPNYVYAY